MALYVAKVNIYYIIAYKVRKRAKIRNRYNQVPHMTQDTNVKVTTLQLDIKNESRDVNSFLAGDHKASKKYNKNQTEIT